MKSHLGWNSRGYLPHFDSGDTVQFVTFRLADSMPANLMKEWRAELATQRLKPSENEQKLRQQVEKYLDSGYGNCDLAQPRIAQIVQDALLFFDARRYALTSWVVMPNHVHALLDVKYGFPLGTILHSWKSFTAKEIAKSKGEGTGQMFWQADYFDRFIRDENHFHRCVFYIENNPVKAGLCAEPAHWKWSSAFLGPRASHPHLGE